MSIPINLPTEKEEALKAQARAHGLSVEEWLVTLVELAAAPPAAGGSFVNLSDLLLNSPFAGAELNLERSQTSVSLRRIVARECKQADGRAMP